MKILIFGASGSGTTTLGEQLAERTGFVHLEVDDYYWRATEPPFQEKVPLAERTEKLTKDFKKYADVIVVGSLVNWGEQWERAFDLAVFIYLDPEIRMARLEKREFDRYGDKLLTDRQTQHRSAEFKQWAKKYDDPDFTGRSFQVHNDWMKRLNCPVLRIAGAMIRQGN